MFEMRAEFIDFRYVFGLVFLYSILVTVDLNGGVIYLF